MLYKTKTRPKQPPRHQSRTWRDAIFCTRSFFWLKKFGALKVLIPIKPWIKSKAADLEVHSLLCWFVGWYEFEGHTQFREYCDLHNETTTSSLSLQKIAKKKTTSAGSLQTFLLPQVETQKCGGLHLGRASSQTVPANKKWLSKWPLWSITMTGCDHMSSQGS